MSGVNQWKMNRAGLLNFWYYDDEVFDFSDGKLLLRGSNGSGKSVTMQSFLPVLLDGKKSPDRLDPFGSKARKMEDYLLGEKEIVNRDERTGYLYIEYKRKDTNQYVTTGIGLQAKRHKPLKFWGFAITDNRRVGVDIALYKNERQAGEKSKVPLSRVELVNLIGEGGQVVQTQGDYMKLVNKHIFGFETIEAYEELIKLLIQLRSPKLSKEFRPTVIYEILEAALPPLSDDDLRHLSDTIEQMDQTKQQIEQLEREMVSLKKLNGVYDTYNQRYLVDQAVEYRKSSRRLNKETKEYENLLHEQEELHKTIEEVTENIRVQTQDKNTYEMQKQRLSSHKVWNLEAELKEEKSKVNVLNDDYHANETKRSREEERSRTLLRQKQDVELDTNRLLKEIDEQLMNMENDADEASFSQDAMNQQDYKRKQLDDFDFTVWSKEAEQHEKKLSDLEEKLRLFEDLREKMQLKNKEIADEQFQLEQHRHQESDWLGIFEGDKENHLKRIYQWTEAHPEFQVTNDALSTVSRNLYSLYEPISYSAVTDTVSPFVVAYQNKLRNDLSELHAREKAVDLKIEEAEQALDEWKNQKDPEPDTKEETKEARQQLLGANVGFAPFYTVVEFQEHVSETVQNRIEAALLDTGILDALIVNQRVAAKHDRILEANPTMMAHTLADFLKPDLHDECAISAEKIDDVLRSIVIGDQGEGEVISIQEDGRYKIGTLSGHALPVERVRYIGRNARRRYREALIEELNGELMLLNEKKQHIHNEKENVEGDIAEASSALNEFPNDKDLDESYQNIKKVRFSIKQIEKQLQKLSDQVKEIDKEYQALKHTLAEQTRDLNLENNRAAYRTAKDLMKRYVKDLWALKSLHIQYRNSHRRYHEMSERLEEIEEDIITLDGELNVLKDRIERGTKNIAVIEQQLAQAGAEDIRKQIRDVQQQLEHIQRELHENNTKLPRLETTRDNQETQLSEKKEKLLFWEQLKHAWREAFQDELERKFVGDFTEDAFESIAQEIEKKYGALLTDKEKSQVESSLSNVFYNQQTNLTEYRMREYQEQHPIPSWMEDVSDDALRPMIEQWKQKTTRRVIELDLLGQQVSPYFVERNLEENFANQEKFLDDQDKELYEEILFKSVGNKLRSRIRRAENWTEKMDELMESSDSSSGLTFSIKWRPRTAETEEELDTKDLVHILKQDAKLLKEQDLERITAHFRSKIAKAKQWIEEKGEGHTLLQVLKEVLDYRKWFSFVLSYQRTNEPKRELTNNKFFTFSGGEKAMAMYIPLFTACYSRYREAEDTAPYIISLDEAFAGVDENNIREMFEIVEQLGFDYIMNSQVLWGDYDTISSLSVCELVRPKNADYVSVLRYKWDGNRLNLKEPEIVLEEEDEKQVTLT
ncbi:TIGR02680 family protein [Bacillus sp. NTK071]|uniref:TIGR02680 family protein n=1 Tax=Bacillus sp. NTK071 TaxID=2802175 RepID=UPI001A8C900D|nr:TIGR02680 family protein [Bacillus sp. NTK071]MBN8208909.1 TIGR02680 family protein [Bacillus sp. NTK071]